MLLKVVTNPVIDPELEPLMLKASPLLLPTIVLIPAPPPPLIEETAPVAPNVKLSVLVPPTRFWILENPLVTPVTVPVLLAVIVQIFATLSAVNVFVPPLPLIDPDKVPPDSVKLSVLLPPTKF